MSEIFKCSVQCYEARVGKTMLPFVTAGMGFSSSHFLQPVVTVSGKTETSTACTMCGKHLQIFLDKFRKNPAFTVQRHWHVGPLEDLTFIDHFGVIPSWKCCQRIFHSVFPCSMHNRAMKLKCYNGNYSLHILVDRNM